MGCVGACYNPNSNPNDYQSWHMYWTFCGLQSVSWSWKIMEKSVPILLLIGLMFPTVLKSMDITIYTTRLTPCRNLSRPWRLMYREWTTCSAKFCSQSQRWTTILKCQTKIVKEPRHFSQCRKRVSFYLEYTLAELSHINSS